MSENANRTMSERVIDRFMRKAEKDTDTEIEQIKVKKVKLEEEPQKEIKPISAVDALKKIQTVLYKENKFLIALQHLQNLLQSSFKKINPNSILEVLYDLSINQMFLKDNFAKRQQAIDIFQFVKNQNIITDSKHKNLFEILQFQGVVHNSLYSDDTYLFHSQLKIFKQELLEMIDEIENPKMKINKVISSIQDKLKKKKEEEIYYPQEFQVSKQFEEILNNDAKQYQFKIQLMVDVIKDFPIYFRQMWTRAGINQIMTDLLENSQIFDENQQQTIDDVRNRLYNLKQVNKNKIGLFNNLDNKHISNPLQSENKFQDSRSVQYVGINSSDSWACRQSGV